VIETVYSANCTGFDPLNENWGKRGLFKHRPQGQGLNVQE